ncbi:MAG: hypothetical protein ACP5UZ_04910 [Thermoplasmata archaeon]
MHSINQTINDFYQRGVIIGVFAGLFVGFIFGAVLEGVRRKNKPP